MSSSSSCDAGTVPMPTLVDRRHRLAVGGMSRSPAAIGRDVITALIIATVLRPDWSLMTSGGLRKSGSNAKGLEFSTTTRSCHSRTARTLSG